MEFINWGSESPEQLAIRRRLEEEALYEQAVRMSQARAGNAPGAVGGGSVAGESLPKYCGGDKTLVEYDFWKFDMLSPDFRLGCFQQSRFRVGTGRYLWPRFDE